MKKAFLLTLIMVCALPISSLNAGLSGWLPSSWTKEASAETKQAHVESAKGYGWGTALALGSSFLFEVLRFRSVSISKDGFSQKELSEGINSNKFKFLSLCLAVSKVATLACAAKAGYDWLQAERIQTKDEN